VIIRKINEIKRTQRTLNEFQENAKKSQMRAGAVA
jgi:hypothetical protein